MLRYRLGCPLPIPAASPSEMGIIAFEVDDSRGSSVNPSESVGNNSKLGTIVWRTQKGDSAGRGRQVRVDPSLCRVEQHLLQDETPHAVDHEADRSSTDPVVLKDRKQVRRTVDNR